MEKLFIEKTESSPEVLLDSDNDIFQIVGESRPENVRKFYEPVFAWFQLLLNKEYVLNNKKEIKIKICLEYFNSTSAKVLYDLFLFLKQQESSFNVSFSIIWHYEGEDEDMLDAGRELEKLSNLKFEYILSA